MNEDNKSLVAESEPVTSGLPTIEKPKTIMEKLTAAFTRNGTFDMSKSVQTANQAWLKAHYGHVKTDEERLDTFLKDLTTDMTTDKSGKGVYAIVKKLPPDLVEYKGGIIELFRSKGYAVADLKDCIEGVFGDYIFLCWDRFDPSKKFEVK